MSRTLLRKSPLYILFDVLEEFSEGSVPRTRFEAMMEAIEPSEIRLLAFYCVPSESLRKRSLLCLQQSRSVNGHRSIEIRRLPLPLRLLIGIIFLGIVTALCHPKGVYVREFVSGLCALPYRLLGLISLVRDVRGLAAEESLHRGKTAPGSFKFALLRWLDRQVMLHATALTCVSRAMCRYLAEEYGIQENRWHVVPNYVSWNPLSLGLARQLRVAARKKLGLTDRLVFVYGGGTSSWQCLPETLRLFQAIKDVEPRAFLLLLTRDVDRMTSLVHDANLCPEDYRIESVPHAQMCSMLCAADWGVALRDGSIVNLVASPTKIVEYLACGLPLILTDTVGDFSSLAKARGIGVVFCPDSLLSSDGIKEVARCILRDDVAVPNNACLKVASRFTKERAMHLWRAVLVARDLSGA